MTESAIWRRLDLAGHDSAILRSVDDGWRLHGCAVFRHEAGPACVDYAVTVDRSWKAQAGSVAGFVGSKEFKHSIARTPDGWRLDGRPVAGLEHLVDLDFGFTPATNLLQLRRVGMAPGARLELPVAWFEVESMALTELRQTYECLSETSYRYAAPTVPYRSQLELVSKEGFVKSYPGLWIMESGCPSKHSDPAAI